MANKGERTHAMTHAIRVHAVGGPEVMVWEQVPTPDPGPGQVLIEHAAVGLNFIDVYIRSGLYKTPLPMTPGMEGAGTIIRLGPGVIDFAEGDRVAYSSAPLGAYAERRVMPADRLVRLPNDISFEAAAGMMMTGLTAQYLLHRTYKVSPGDTVLIFAAAGGVGLVMCQWAKHLGATVIGVVSNEAKAALAKTHGADHVLLSHEDIPSRVREITSGAMVPVVYDSVGRDTFTASLDSLAPLGIMVSYGSASGPVPPRRSECAGGQREPLPHAPEPQHLYGEEVRAACRSRRSLRPLSRQASLKSRWIRPSRSATRPRRIVLLNPARQRAAPSSSLERGV